MKKLLQLSSLLLLAIAGCSNTDEKTMKNEEEIKSSQIEDVAKIKEENDKLKKEIESLNQTAKDNLSDDDIAMTYNIAYRFVRAIALKDYNGISAIAHDNVGSYDKKENTISFDDDKSIVKMFPSNIDSLRKISFGEAKLKEKDMITLTINYTEAEKNQTTP
ncbi:hypothetical protein [Bacillus sp. JJ722]|uniref:hypothetical protein n=1 Tax=Bacillus sp. JJ722 TaxID=3122973 RepID=UPI003000942A